jgi:hypothetical protein
VATVVWSRRLIWFAAAAIFVATAASALGSPARGGPLTGTWSGFIAGHPGSGVKRQHIVITVNASQNGGSWKLSNACYGPLRLDSISSGYHHYLRKPARGVRCRGGDIDCLKRAGANVYDAVTARQGGAYDSGGTLRRSRAG